jgi:uncharacterized membrane protein YhaH (DUF805 family)
MKHGSGRLITAKQHARRKTLSQLWFAAVILYSLVRALIVWQALGDYGVNPWIYLGIDLVCAIIDGRNTARLIISLADQRYHDARKQGVIAMITFIVPDLYIVYAGNHMPKIVYFSLAGIVTLMLTIGVFQVKKKVASVRAEREAEARGERTVVIDA